MTIDIRYGAETRTLKYKGTNPKEYLMLLLNDLGFEAGEGESVFKISSDDKAELKRRIDDYKSGKTKPITVAQLDKKIALRLKK